MIGDAAIANRRGVEDRLRVAQMMHFLRFPKLLNGANEVDAEDPVPPWDPKTEHLDLKPEVQYQMLVPKPLYPTDSH